MTSVEWLARIDALTEPFTGYQQRVAYWYKQAPDDPGEPVQRIRPRALMVPPGFPDFLSRARTVERGRIAIAGRAWSGLAPIARVEVSVDGTWSEAALGPVLGPYAWRAWSYAWDAVPGEHILGCRAFDEAGNAQPLEQPWNLQGMGNNLVQRVPVVVRPTPGPPDDHPTSAG